MKKKVTRILILNITFVIILGFIYYIVNNNYKNLDSKWKVNNNEVIWNNTNSDGSKWEDTNSDNSKWDNLKNFWWSWKMAERDVETEKLFLNNELIWSIIKGIKLDDFANLKLSKDLEWKKENIIRDKNEVLDVISQNLLQIKSYQDNDISICDKWVKYKQEDIIEQESLYCKGGFYINQLLIKKDKQLCNNFKKWFENIELLGSKIAAESVCNKLYELTIDESVNEQKIVSFISEINWWEVDKEMLSFLKTNFLWENFCNDVDTVWWKVKCLSYYYKNDFFKEFETKVYPEIIKSTYLYLY